MGRNKKSEKSRRNQVRRLTEPEESYSPAMSRPILPGGWQVNTAMFLLLMIGTLALYWRDLGIGFFMIDDYGYVTDDPSLRRVAFPKLREIEQKFLFLFACIRVIRGQFFGCPNAFGALWSITL